jgi:outer membrane protein OmpA-like peptidoglycan-associated protein
MKVMKNLFLIVGIIIFDLSIALSQGFNQHSISLNLGNHFGISNVGQLKAKTIGFNHFDFNYRFMHSNKFGWKSTISYDNFSFKNQENNTTYFRFSIEPTINLRELLGLSEFTDKFGALAHFGIGISSMWSKNVLGIKQTKLFFINSGTYDNMLLFTYGITPTYKINNKFTLNLDISRITHSRQEIYFDFLSTIQEKSRVGGGMINFTFGATMSIGPRKHHADWYTFPTLIDKDLEKINLLEIQIEQLEMKLEDFDFDGVSNYLDDEPNTPKGNQVDARGVTISKLGVEIEKEKSELDSIRINNSQPNKTVDNKNKVNNDTQKPDKDKDGVPDEYDMCPDAVGTFKGCPDADGDKIPDIIDDCPNIKGFPNFRGCPDDKKSMNINDPKKESEQKYETIEENIEPKSFSDIFFDAGISTLSINAIKQLDELVTYLKNNPKVIVEATGFADQSGSKVANEKLSKQRVDECVNYMVSKGIEKARFSTSYKIVENKDGVNPLFFGAKNRRVSFYLKNN